MENENQHLIFNTILLFISLIWVNFDLVRNTKEFWEAIKGKDKVLQVTEICIYIWIRILPIVVLGDLFLNLTLEKEAWYSLDIIFASLVLGDLGYAHLKKDSNDRTKDNSTPD